MINRIRGFWYGNNIESESNKERKLSQGAVLPYVNLEKTSVIDDYVRNGGNNLNVDPEITDLETMIKVLTKNKSSNKLRDNEVITDSCVLDVENNVQNNVENNFENNAEKESGYVNNVENKKIYRITIQQFRPLVFTDIDTRIRYTTTPKEKGPIQEMYEWLSTL